MYTVIETEYFQSRAVALLTDVEIAQLVCFLADNPFAGAVIPGSDGCRKLRWALPGKGKSGGARVIYVNYLSDGWVVLLTVYAKTVQGNIPAHLLRALKDAFDEN